MDNAFRKLPVDDYSEDRVLESDLYDPDPRDPFQVLADTRSKQTQIRTLLQRGDVKGALEVGLEQAPYGEGVEEAKVSRESLSGRETCGARHCCVV